MASYSIGRIRLPESDINKLLWHNVTRVFAEQSNRTPEVKLHERGLGDRSHFFYSIIVWPLLRRISLDSNEMGLSTEAGHQSHCQMIGILSSRDMQICWDAGSLLLLHGTWVQSKVGGRQLVSTCMWRPQLYINTRYPSTLWLVAVKHIVHYSSHRLPRYRHIFPLLRMHVRVDVSNKSPPIYAAQWFSFLNGIHCCFFIMF